MRAIPGVSLPAPTSFADCLIASLVQLGVRQAFGLIGGAIGPFCSALGRSTLQSFQCRQETGAAFAATEAYFATGNPTIVFVTTGPGITNALTGLLAARWDGAKVVLISGATSAGQRGRWAVQETSSRTMALGGVFNSGDVFDYAVTIESPSELAGVVQALRNGFTQAGGFVAHLCLPIDVQMAPTVAPSEQGAGFRASQPSVSLRTLLECVELLKNHSSMIWVGHGARQSAEGVRLLAERLGAPVMSSPRGKGIFPEEHPLYIGVTGCGGHESVERFLATRRPDYCLVLGSRLGEFTSTWAGHYLPSMGLIHIDINPRVFGAAYPDVQTLGVHAELGQFLEALLALLQAPLAPRGPALVPLLKPMWEPRESPGVRPQLLMAEVQRQVVEATDIPVFAESGNAFAWGNNLLRFARANQYRVSGLWGSMGHAVCGVVGCAVGRQGKSLALVGDAAMLMLSEVSTAVQYRAAAIWVVLNDGQMGIVDKAMRLQGLQPFHTQLPPTNFAALGNSLGATGIRVDYESQLPAALQQALEARGPVVLDVLIDRTQMPPVLQRVSTLKTMGAKGPGVL